MGKFSGMSNEEYLRLIADQEYTAIEEELITRLQAEVELGPRPDIHTQEYMEDILNDMNFEDIIDFMNRKREG